MFLVLLNLPNTTSLRVIGPCPLTFGLLSCIVNSSCDTVLHVKDIRAVLDIAEGIPIWLYDHESQ